MSRGVDFVNLIERQRQFSEGAFGPEYGADRIADHLLKELSEAAEAPNDLEEWADIILLALDGAWRSGYEPREIAETVCVRFADLDPHQVYWSCRAMSLEDHIARQKMHVFRDRLPRAGIEGILTTLRYEIYTLARDFHGLQTWLNIVFLGLTGACLTGESPRSIERAIAGKLAKNETREWPDWRAVTTDRAIEHIRR